MSSMLDLGGAPPDTIQIPPSGGPSDQSQDTSSDPVQSLQDAIDALMAYQKSEKDAVDRATASKVLAQLHALQAKDQQDSDSAMKGTISPRYARKAGASPSGPAY